MKPLFIGNFFGKFNLFLFHTIFFLFFIHLILLVYVFACFCTVQNQFHCLLLLITNLAEFSLVWFILVAIACCWLLSNSTQISVEIKFSWKLLFFRFYRWFFFYWVDSTVFYIFFVVFICVIFIGQSMFVGVLGNIQFLLENWKMFVRNLENVHSTLDLINICMHH